MRSHHPQPPRDDDEQRELEAMQAAIGPRWSARRVLGVVLLLGGVAAAVTWATRSPQSVPWAAVGRGPMDLEQPTVVEHGEIADFLERHGDELADDAATQRPPR
jgi:hypothetical protein